MRFKDIERELEQLGFVFSRVKGSHYHYHHEDGIRPVILCHKARNNDFGPALVSRILKEAKQSIDLGRQAKQTK